MRDKKEKTGTRQVDFDTKEAYLELFHIEQARLEKVFTNFSAPLAPMMDIEFLTEKSGQSVLGEQDIQDIEEIAEQTKPYLENIRRWEAGEATVEQKESAKALKIEFDEFHANLNELVS